MQAEGATPLAKKVGDLPVMIREGWIDLGATVAVVQQYVLAGVSRATVYAQKKSKPVDKLDLLHRRLIDEEYIRKVPRN